MNSRLIGLFTNEGLDKIRKVCVAVIGVGGVGGTSALSLVRSGITNILICDFDIIEETNLNRQVISTTKNIGKNKVDVLEQMILDINPKCNVIKIKEKYNEEIFDKYQINYVIDAIDDIPSKCELISNCIDRKIIFISSMGAAKKIDPSKVTITTIDKTSYDPIAKVLRSRFKNKKFNVVSSTEEAKCNELSSYINVTSVFGLYLSHFIIDKILRS